MIAIQTHPFAFQRRACSYGPGCWSSIRPYHKNPVRTSRARFPHAQIEDLESKILLSVELPGVKSNDVSVTAENWVLAVSATRGTAGNDTKFQRNFPIDKKTLDVNDIKVSLKDGILFVSIPKKPAAASWTVPVRSEYPPEKNEDTFHAVFELPGVKQGDIQVAVRGDELSIMAKRMFGDSKSVTKRAFEIDDDALDMDSVSAYLADGILTLALPEKEAKEQSKRSFPVNLTSAPAKATETYDVGMNADEEEEIVVETVGEEEEEEDENEVKDHEWEAVEGNGL
mmetsp:Transcript_5362/g.11004  ORF Transcript_5362/g.11004 Transcript_5362/m.11004 type:complete len:284 (-) Transcript_5362:122-973(-)|eukprot:CAMPEP_0168741488 /NCGR_PEP_ID=MMETSP0724-20121128/12542_1 /TAXON_ID=265536 /ORGANISM="Amphiprora sp., Strain CCMP467" /LENGTH=283 /DNA_ID=CAMNT_0008788999 /DNA_START=26 /DNA_END=877 /DNA_ORIENTATION=-